MPLYKLTKPQASRAMSALVSYYGDGSGDGGAYLRALIEIETALCNPVAETTDLPKGQMKWLSMLASHRAKKHRTLYAKYGNRPTDG